MRHITLITMVLVVALVASSCATVAESEKLQITKTESALIITVPVSQLTMTVPQLGFSPERESGGGSADSPRYFKLLDERRAVIASGWFESAERYGGIERLWKEDTAEWAKAGLPQPHGVVMQKIGGWSAVLYHMPMPAGASNSHIRAEFTLAGTWIDLHLSITSTATDAECRQQLIDLLRSIKVEEKPKAG